MEKTDTNQDTAGKVQKKVQNPNEEDFPDKDSAGVEEKSTRRGADVKDRGDCKQEPQKYEKPATIKETTSDTSHTRTQEASETTISPTHVDKKEEQINGLKREKNEETSAKDNTDGQSGDVFSEGKAPSTNKNQDGSCEENLHNDQAHSQEHTFTAANSSSSQSADISITIQDRDSSEKEVQSVAEAHSKNNPSQADGKQASPQHEKQVTMQELKPDESRVTKNEASELITSQILNKEKDDQADELKSELNEKASENQFGDALEEKKDKHESPTQREQQLEESSNVETIGPATPEATQPEAPQVFGGSGKYLIALAIFTVVLAIVVQLIRQPEPLPQTNDVRQIDVFLRQLEKIKTRFPNQRVELWNRSRIHLTRHLEITHPTEPVSLILTAGLKAEKTLNCLALGLASAFSSALNASVLHIDGASKASQDSDQVKLDIDRKLQGAFEGDKPVAVIHRFEELPPGSTLIFYRYCDHENAAYKKTFLIFTVLLGEEDEIPAKISLCAIEEMVDDHLQKKFLTHEHPVSFDMMDLDKYGGLWSRISHLILPVAAEERIELEGC